MDAGIPLAEVRKNCLNGMETWFCHGLLGLGTDTDTMEADYRSWFGDNLMNSIKHPKCVIVQHVYSNETLHAVF